MSTGPYSKKGLKIYKDLKKWEKSVDKHRVGGELHSRLNKATLQYLLTWIGKIQGDINKIRKEFSDQVTKLANKSIYDNQNIVIKSLGGFKTNINFPTIFEMDAAIKELYALQSENSEQIYKVYINRLVDMKNDKFLKAPQTIERRRKEFWTAQKKEELSFQYERTKIIENINETIKFIESQNKNSNKKNLQKVKEDLRKKVDNIDKEIKRVKQKFINIFSELLHSIIRLNKKLPPRSQLKNATLPNNNAKNISNKLINYISKLMKNKRLIMIKNAYSINKKFFVMNTIKYDIEKVPPLVKMDGIIKELKILKNALQRQTGDDSNNNKNDPNFEPNEETSQSENESVVNSENNFQSREPRVPPRFRKKKKKKKKNQPPRPSTTANESEGSGVAAQNGLTNNNNQPFTFSASNASNQLRRAYNKARAQRPLSRTRANSASNIYAQQQKALNNARAKSRNNNNNNGPPFTFSGGLPLRPKSYSANNIYAQQQKGLNHSKEVRNFRQAITDLKKEVKGSGS